MRSQSILLCTVYTRSRISGHGRKRFRLCHASRPPHVRSIKSRTKTTIWFTVGFSTAREEEDYRAALRKKNDGGKWHGQKELAINKHIYEGRLDLFFSQFRKKKESHDVIFAREKKSFSDWNVWESFTPCSEHTRSVRIVKVAVVCCILRCSK